MAKKKSVKPKPKPGHCVMGEGAVEENGGIDQLCDETSNVTISGSEIDDEEQKRRHTEDGDTRRLFANFESDDITEEGFTDGDTLLNPPSGTRRRRRRRSLSFG